MATEPIKINTSAPASLHPANVDAIEGLTDDNRHLVEPVAALFQKGTDACIAVHDARLAVEGDPTLTPAARALKVGELADRKSMEFAVAHDTVIKSLTRQVATTVAEIAKPLESATHTSQAQEIRSILRNLPTAERNSAISNAVAKGDKTICAAMLAAHPLQSGLAPEQIEHYTRLWNARSQPELSKRLLVLERALALATKHGQTVREQADRHVGVSTSELRSLRAAAAKTAKAFA